MSRTYATTCAASLTSSTAKTVVELGTGSGVAAEVNGIDVSFDGSLSGVNVLVEVITFTATGTGTSFTPWPQNGEAKNLAAQATAKVNDTVEPTGSVTVRRKWYVPMSALFPYLIPLDEGIYVPPSSFVGIRLTPGAFAIPYAVNVLHKEG